MDPGTAGIAAFQLLTTTFQHVSFSAFDLGISAFALVISACQHFSISAFDLDPRTAGLK